MTYIVNVAWDIFASGLDWNIFVFIEINTSIGARK